MKVFYNSPNCELLDLWPEGILCNSGEMGIDELTSVTLGTNDYDQIY